VSALHDRFGVAFVAPGHCTGEPAFRALRERFGDRYVYAGLGTVLSAGRRVRSTLGALRV
jgi:7,8-dihydropterin-6-yl-methyl-4-(beta-D-ribofuranosyl)aminobenzene 5'-phosphate synthase